jgi:AcrR family transcriptional regulator
MALLDRRRRILESALACFLEDGYEQTTIARIRERSGVSNGALFHHFRSKDAIADALYVEAIDSFQEGLWQLVRRRPRSLRAAVHGTISHQLEWTEQHADRARFVYMRGHLDWDSPAGAEVAALNRDVAVAFREWMAPLVDRGEIRTTSMLVISAIVNGPAHALARRWLDGGIKGTLTAFVDELADAAWAGLRGKPVPARAAERVPRGSRTTLEPRTGRVTLELVTEDGSVLAQGHATTELVPVRRSRA